MSIVLHPHTRSGGDDVQNTNIMCMNAWGTGNDIVFRILQLLFFATNRSIRGSSTVIDGLGHTLLDTNCGVERQRQLRRVDGSALAAQGHFRFLEPATPVSNISGSDTQFVI